MSRRKGQSHDPLTEIPEGRPIIARLFKGGFAVQKPMEPGQGYSLPPPLLGKTTHAGICVNSEQATARLRNHPELKEVLQSLEVAILP